VTEPRIGLLAEGPLHRALKAWYAEPGDELEVPVEGCVIDLVRADLLVEIQTGNFSALKPKLARLLPSYRVRVVYPVPESKWIVRLDEAGEVLSRRKSPKHGRSLDVFYELVRLAPFLASERLELELVYEHEEEVRRYEAHKAWRRKGWVILHRRLLEVLGSERLLCPADLARFLPADLPERFDSAELAEALSCTRPLACKVAYCLQAAGLLERRGKRGNAWLYSRR